MRWEDERFVKVYTRDTANWLSLSFEAQALWLLLLRKLDRAGVIELGRLGKRGIAAVIGHAGLWERLAPAVEELIAVGFLAVEGERAIAPNFAEAQEARQSARARKASQRERERDCVTQCHTQSRGVTPRHAESHGVTQSHTASPLDQTRSDQNNKSVDNPAHAGPLPPAETNAGQVESVSECAKADCVKQPATALPSTQLSFDGVGSNPPATEATAGRETPSARDLKATPEALRDCWNAEANPALPRWRNGPMSAARRKAATARLRERGIEGADGFREVIRRISASSFCCGAKGWIANPAWLLRPDTAERVLEGAFDDRGPPKPQAKPAERCAVPGCEREAGERCGLWDNRLACREHLAAWEAARGEAFAEGREPAIAFGDWLESAARECGQ